MKPLAVDHGLAFLLDFDGRVHYLEEGYWLKFETKRVTATTKRPNGIDYSLTLHAPDGTRLLGFDNAHPVSTNTSRRKKRPEAADHWHRRENDLGRPYEFTDAATLLADFFREVERILIERGIGTMVVKEVEKRRSK